MARIVLEQVSKEFPGGVQAVREVSLEIENGEFMVLVGPSGCGKSTLLRMLAGLEDITAGTIAIDGRVVNDLDSKDRDIAMVFQSYALYPHMTVRENMGFSLRLRKESVRRIAEGVDRAARILNLEPYLERYPRELSGGQRQRVALARAFVGRPKAFLMDEPLSNLDAKLRAATRLELVDLHRRVETTVVYVTHDQVEAMTMADRIAIMSAGRLQQVGTPQDVYEAPANLFVAQFIGTPPMNTLPGTVALSDGGPATVDVGGGRVPVPPGLTTSLGDGQPVVVGIRPEHLTVVPEGPVEQQVRAVEWLGHECLVFGAVGEAPVVVRQTGMATVAAGGTARLAVDPDQVHLFDADTTERLT